VKRTVDEIVHAVMEALKPWPTREQIDTKLIKKTNSASAIEKAVREEIERLHDSMRVFCTPEAKKETREGAKRIRAAITRLEEQIARATKASSPEMWLRLLERPLDLEWLRQVCDAVIEGRGEDQRKIGCARAAMYLVLKFSANKPTSGSRTSPLRQIAGLLYEAIGGEPDLDIERACEVVLRERRRLIQTQKEKLVQ
jgi:hypothetical protein